MPQVVAVVVVLIFFVVVLMLLSLLLMLLLMLLLLLRTTVSKQASRLQVCESENSSLREQVALMNESLSVITLEREELRSMNQQNSAQLRKALEVRVCVCACVVCIYVYCVHAELAFSNSEFTRRPKS